MKDLTRGNVLGQLARFAVPMVLGNLAQQLYGVADSAIVGRVLGYEALAAVGASFPVQYVVISFVIGIGSGGSTLVSQYFGAADRAAVRRMIDTLTLFIVGVSVPVALAGLAGSRALLRLTGVPPVLLPMAQSYLDVYFAGCVVAFGFNTVISVARGLGDSVSPLRFLALSAILNIVFDVLFLVVFDWGVSGVAFATIVAQAVAMLFAVRRVNRLSAGLTDFARHWPVFDRGLFSKAVRLGLPTALQQASVALGGVVNMAIINGFGPVVMAAYSVASRLDSLATMPAMNLGSTLSVFTGQNMGAGQVRRVRKGLRATLLMSCSVALVLGAVAFFGGPTLISLFTDDVHVIEAGARYLTIIGPFFVVFSAMFALMGLLRGAGATVVPMAASIVSLWGVLVPTSLLLSRAVGYVGIWWAVAASWVAGLIPLWIYYRSNRWTTKAVVSVRVNTEPLSGS